MEENYPILSVEEALAKFPRITFIRLNLNACRFSTCSTMCSRRTWSRRTIFRRTRTARWMATRCGWRTPLARAKAQPRRLRVAGELAGGLHLATRPSNAKPRFVL